MAAVLLFLAAAIPVRAVESEAPLGLGIVLGEGIGDQGADVRKAGFTTRQLQSGDRRGALSLMAEEFTDGIPVVRIDRSLNKKDVHVTYQAVYLELKRYFPVWKSLGYFWGLRGGMTRVSGTVDRGSGNPKDTFQQDQAAPVWFLAAPLALENPGFLLLGLLEGGSAGISLDLVPGHVWLEATVSAALVPHYRDASIAIDTPFVMTRTLSISMAF